MEIYTLLIHECRSVLLGMLICFSNVSHVSSQMLAFPGAEGFGAYSQGGRGGDVYIVTNLESDKESVCRFNYVGNYVKPEHL